MSGKYSDISNWSYLLDKATKKPYLGRINTRWGVVNKKGGRIVITLFKEKLIRSAICSSLLLAFLLILPSLIQSSEGNSSFLGLPFLWLIIGIPFIWLAIGLRLGYTRALSWKRNSDEITTRFGFYPFLKDISLGRAYLSATLEWLNESKKQKVIMYLQNSEQPTSRLKLISAVKRSWVIPVFDAVTEILGGNSLDKTVAIPTDNST